MTLMPGTTTSARPVRALLAAALSVAVAAGTLTLTAAPAAANDDNQPPGVPTELQTSGQPCTAAEPYQLWQNNDLVLSAVLHDPDVDVTGSTDRLTATFALWPVDEPTARIERFGYYGREGDRESGLFERETLTHDRVYAWQVRAADDQATGEWSGLCYFRTDFEGPAVAPTVTSTDFPTEGWHPALPGQFTFDAAATPDAVGFRYELLGVSGIQTVPADRPGGSATVTLRPDDGPRTLVVSSLDEAGNRSPEAQYEFRASDVSPIITGKLTEVGVPTTFTVQPQMAGVVRYRFQLDGDPEQTAEAAPDGTATLTVTATRAGSRTLSVTSVTADGVTATTTSTFVLTTAPKISATVYQQGGTSGGPGVPGVFTFTPRQPDVVSYLYRFNTVTGTVAAAADGTASVTWTPTKAGLTSLSVRSVDRDGNQSDAASFTFFVRNPPPSS
ncbi:hypothetical protein [Micromonospora chokoriensis]|uniref:hypothetical protein n=1 Tax=Micromonospora chokoriensis TaxID=356851 RepID=UPI000AD40F97|nr:hypothetical protein [Micromonospora chokoriensis]